MKKFIVVTCATVALVLSAGMTQAATEKILIGTGEGRNGETWSVWTAEYYGKLVDELHSQQYLDNDPYKDAAVAYMRANSGESVDIRIYNHDPSSQDYQVLGSDPTGWYMESDVRSWIGVWNGESANDPSYSDTAGEWNLGGFYAFSTTLNMLYDFEKLSLDIFHDNEILAVYLTCAALGIDDEMIRSSYDGYENYQTPAVYDLPGPYEAGEYTLTIYMMNGKVGVGDIHHPWGTIFGPVGILVEGEASFDTSTSPEPATLLILGFGAAGAGLVVRRRNRK